MLSQQKILNYLKTYKEKKKDTYSIKRLGLFGSYARGDEKEKSDIDIVVDFNESDLFYQIGIMQDLEEAFGRDVDVIALWKQMNPKLRSRIEKDVIYV